VEMIKKNFPQVILKENKENFGFGKANNQGMKMSKGDYIFLLNSDTIVQDNAVRILVDYLDTNKDTMMVGPRLLNADFTFQHACRRKLPTPLNSFYHLFGLVHIFKKNKTINSYKKYTDDPNITEPIEALSGAAMMFRREVFENIGGFDEKFFMYGEDLDFCKRIYDQGWKTVYVSESKIVHLGGGSSKKRRTKSLINFYDSMWIYYVKHYKAKNNFVVNLVVFCAINLKKYLVLVFNFFKK